MAHIEAKKITTDVKGGGTAARKFCLFKHGDQDKAGLSPVLRIRDPVPF